MKRCGLVPSDILGSLIDGERVSETCALMTVKRTPESARLKKAN